MNLQTRPHKNGKATEAMRQAIMSASLKQEDKQKALAIWRDFKWKILTTTVTSDDILAMIGAAQERIRAEIVGNVLKEQLLERFELMKSRTDELAARPSEFLGPPEEPNEPPTEPTDNSP
jgi:hypothetical protein